MRCLKVKSLEFLDGLMIDLEESGVCIEHRSKFEYRVAHSQCVHVDEQHLIVLELQILCVVVTVDHVIVLRYGFNHGKQLLCLVFRQVILHEFCPANDSILHIRQFAFRDQRRVDKLEHLYILLYAPVEFFRLIGYHP